jgi:hypothetical protein
MDSTQLIPQLPSKINSKVRNKRRRYSKKNKSNEPGKPDATPKGGGNEGGSASKLGKFPYPTDYNDHFETPARAYDDIFPLIHYILVKTQNMHACSKSTIYDPYYCAGRAATLLREQFQERNSTKLSIPIHIQHEKRDFYRDIRQNTVPPFDILVTNPPYSENHKERCLEFAVNQLKKHGRPFFLLMPNYVAMKEYFRKIVLDDKDNNGSHKVRAFYIAPSSKHPYEYDHPDGTGHVVSPFASVWFCGLSCNDGKIDTDTKDVVDAFDKFHSPQSQSPTGTPRIMTTLQELIQLGVVSGARRKNPRQRKKMRNEAMRGTNSNAVGGGLHSTSKKRKAL